MPRNQCLYLSCSLPKKLVFPSDVAQHESNKNSSAFVYKNRKDFSVKTEIHEVSVCRPLDFSPWKPLPACWEFSPHLPNMFVTHIYMCMCMFVIHTCMCVCVHIWINETHNYIYIYSMYVQTYIAACFLLLVFFVSVCMSFSYIALIVWG